MVVVAPLCGGTVEQDDALYREDIPTDNLFAAPVMAADIQARFGDR